MTNTCKLCKTAGDLVTVTFQDEQIRVCKECADAINGHGFYHRNRHNPVKQEPQKPAVKMQSRAEKYFADLARSDMIKKRVEGIAKRKKIHYERNPPKSVDRHVSKNTQQRKLEW
jgi:ribosome-binding protein aMBF1 (putative translation factor)